MATRALIGYLDEDRNFTCTYNHYDGYPDHLGKDTIKYAEEINADLIMIMTKSETGKLADLFVGSYAEQIVNSSQKTPVMCINPKPTGAKTTGGSGFY